MNAASWFVLIIVASVLGIAAYNVFKGIRNKNTCGYCRCCSCGNSGCCKKQ